MLFPKDLRKTGKLSVVEKLELKNSRPTQGIYSRLQFKWYEIFNFYFVNI